MTNELLNVRTPLHKHTAFTGNEDCNKMVVRMLSKMKFTIIANDGYCIIYF